MHRRTFTDAHHFDGGVVVDVVVEAAAAQAESAHNLPLLQLLLLSCTSVKVWRQQEGETVKKV